MPSEQKCSPAQNTNMGLSAAKIQQNIGWAKRRGDFVCTGILSDQITDSIYIIMYRLNLPPFEVRTIAKSGRPFIYDMLRRKYVALTPEEWVRQHFVHFLVEHKGYPAAYLANEVELKVGTKKLRCDSVLYDTALRPRMIIEYKAPTVAIRQAVFNQISTYNLLLHVDYLIVSNGIRHFCCKMDYASGRYVFLNDIPDHAVL